MSIVLLYFLIGTSLAAYMNYECTLECRDFIFVLALWPLVVAVLIYEVITNGKRP